MNPRIQIFLESVDNSVSSFVVVERPIWVVDAYRGVTMARAVSTADAVFTIVDALETIFVESRGFADILSAGSTESIFEVVVVFGCSIKA